VDNLRKLPKERYKENELHLPGAGNAEMEEKGK
jgi:hypothetical protein